MTESVNTKWTGKMSFDWEVGGHTIKIDADEKVGGENKGPKPKPFMLASLGGCTAMDVISILTKMRVTKDIEDFSVNVSGGLTEEHPKQFNKMHIQYIFVAKEGAELPMEKLKKAVSLSEDRYCGVSAVYKKVMPVTSEIIVK